MRNGKLRGAVFTRLSLAPLRFLVNHLKDTRSISWTLARNRPDRVSMVRGIGLQCLSLMGALVAAPLAPRLACAALGEPESTAAKDARRLEQCEHDRVFQCGKCADAACHDEFGTPDVGRTLFGGRLL